MSLVSPEGFLLLFVCVSPSVLLSLYPRKAQRTQVFPGGCGGNLATGKAVIISFQSISG